MIELYLLVWELFAFIAAFMFMYYALNALDFSKLFKPNSTRQIRIIITLVSSAVAFAISFGFGEILKLIANLFN